MEEPANASSASSSVKVMLLCVDLQPPFLSALPNGAALVRRCAFVIEAAEALGVAIGFTEQVPEKLGSTTPALTTLAKRRITWAKTAFSALADAKIRDDLRASAAEHLLI